MSAKRTQSNKKRTKGKDDKGEEREGEKDPFRLWLHAPLDALAELGILLAENSLAGRSLVGDETDLSRKVLVVACHRERLGMRLKRDPLAMRSLLAPRIEDISPSIFHVVHARNKAVSPR